MQKMMFAISLATGLCTHVAWTDVKKSHIPSETAFVACACVPVRLEST